MTNAIWREGLARFAAARGGRGSGGGVMRSSSSSVAAAAVRTGGRAEKGKHRG